MSRVGAAPRAQQVDRLVAGDRDQPALRAAAAGLEAAGAVPDLDERLLHGFLGIAAVAKNTQRHAVEFPAGLAVEARESRPVAQAAARQQLPRCRPRPCPSVASRAPAVKAGRRAPCKRKRRRLTSGPAAAPLLRLAHMLEAAHALDPARRRRPLRGRLGDRPQVHRGLHPAAADRPDRALDGRSASGSSASRSATCRSAPPTRSGPASARSAPRRSASCSSATRPRSAASPASG